MKVKDFVRIDQHGEFISAVQLSDFDSPGRNSLLVRSFIFSDNAPDSIGMEKKYHGTINLLEKFINSFKSPTNFNVLMVLADYGHGKSHFALESMNFFEKPNNSPEVEIVLDRIKLAIPNQPDKAGKFNTFKEERDRFIVLNLDGTSGKSIREMLYAALVQGLSRYPGSTNVRMPFWNDDAVNWLQEKRDDQHAKDFLANEFHTDFSNLIQDVKMNKDGAWQQYTALFKELNYGVEPNPSGNKYPKEVINWIVQEYVGDGKPFSGLVIFFDEFSQFIHFYSKGRMDGTLMNLLEGVGENKQKALLVGFGQHDPGEIALDAAHDHTVAESIQKELNRLEEKFNLYSLVESVLDSYLSNSSESWDILINESPHAKAGFLGHVSEFSWDLFYDRYANELKWDNQKFREVVVKGCYPLHPTTTGLLAHLKMVSDFSDDARTMLRFVQKAYDLKKDEEIMDGKKVNWVYPIELVDHFEERITDSKSYVEYTTALQNLHTILAESVIPDHIKMLKAMLIQKADQKFSYNKYKQIELLSHYCGLNSNEGKDILKTLRENNIIRYIDVPGSYMFWPTGINPQALENEIKHRLSMQRFDFSTLLKLENRLSHQSDLFDGFRPVEVNLDWGHPSDWAAEQKIFTRETFTAENISKLVPPFEFRLPSIKQPVKGVVVWCLPLFDEDVEFFRQKSLEILNTAFENLSTPPPILLILPRENQSELASLFLRYETLIDMGLSEQSKNEFGADQISGEIRRAVNSLQDKFRKFFSRAFQQERFEERFSMPQVYQSQISNIALGYNPIQRIIEELYRLVYKYRPNYFFNDIKGFGNTNVTKATKKVAAFLAKNNVKIALDANHPTPIEKRLIEDFLIRQWKILSSSYSIIEPSDNRLKKAWDYLNDNIRPDQNEVKLINIIPKMLSAPFGFDFNTALLLFSAWVGFHYKEVSFTQNNRETTIRTLFDDLSINKKPTAQMMLDLFLVEHLAISREDPSVIETEIKALLEKIKVSAHISEDQGQSMSAKLEDFLEKEQGSGHHLEEDCSSAFTFLENNLGEVKKYNQQVDEILKNIHTQSDVANLKMIETTIRKLNYPKFIETDQPDLAELQQQLEAQFESLVNEICAEPEKLENIENVGLIRKKILDHQNLLSDRINLVQKLSEALNNLNMKVEELHNKGDEKRYREQLVQISENSSLQKLQDDIKFIQSKNYPAKFDKEVTEKIERMNTRVEELQRFAELVIERYQLISKSDLSAFRDKVVSKMFLYQGSNYEKKLSLIKTYFDTIEIYFSDLNSLLRIDTTNLPEIISGLENLEKIKEKYENQISKEHIEQLTQLTIKLNQAYQDQIIQFEKKLNDIENVLQMELEQVSGTLNILEFENKIKSLRKNNLDGFTNRLDKVENDLIIIKKEMDEKFALAQIEQLFKKLDSNKKLVCLQRLNDLK